mgnify:FL=1
MKKSINKRYSLFDLFKIIIDKKYESKINNEEHINALLEAINRSSKDDVTYVNENKLTCLHFAVQINSPEIVKALIEKGADVNAITDRGVTPLHLAIVKKQPEEIIKVLVENGADYHIKEANFSAIELAKLMDVDYMHLFEEQKK